jgi:hypothetical protein
MSEIKVKLYYILPHHLTSTTMAHLVSQFQFVGKLGDLSAYKMRGSDKIIVRRKGGASKNKIKTSPVFINTRQINSEFGGRSVASGWIMRILEPVKPMADYNIAGPLNALLKPVQVIDDKIRGKRGVLLSKNRRLLEGFPLNRGVTFESMVRTTLTWELSRETLSAKVNVPQLIRGINFHTPQHSWYKIVTAMGIIPDIVYDEKSGYCPVNKSYDTRDMLTKTETPWLAVMTGGEATTLELKCNVTPPDENFSVMLSVGIAFGKVISESEIAQVPHAGSAKVIGVV